MIFYPLTRMVDELLAQSPLPKASEQRFLENLRASLPREFTMTEYNYVLDLFNKYIVVPAGPNNRKLWV